MIIVSLVHIELYNDNCVTSIESSTMSISTYRELYNDKCVTSTYEELYDVNCVTSINVK